ncbi:afadin- and alpha-actinin-binding protein A isoform X2 [Anabrus simplex]|uniref:afadin- and alpha-actinin-binding protein A isoform X2 n=1 Tax=Anabrus simplex TaxID=316456 RepID=UPI0035A3919C
MSKNTLKELELFGLQPIPKYQPFKSQLEMDMDEMALVLKTVTNATFSLIQHHRRVVHEHEEADEKKQRLIDDSNILRVAKDRLNQLLAEREQSLKLMAEKERALKEKYDATCRILKGEREEIRRLRSQLKQKEDQFNREMRKKDQIIARLETQLSQVMSTGSLRKPIKKLPSDEEVKLEKLNEAKEDAYKRVINKFESNNENLVKENLTLAGILYRLTSDLALVVDGYNGLMRVCFKMDTQNGGRKEEMGESVEHSSNDPSELSLKECKSQIYEYIGILNDILDFLKNKLVYEGNNYLNSSHAESLNSESKQEAQLW